MLRIHLTPPPPSPRINRDVNRPTRAPRQPDAAGQDSRAGERNFAAGLLRFAVEKLATAVEAAAAASSLSPDITRLARAYAPILVFHPDEQYFPADPLEYIEYSEHRRHRAGLPDESLAELGEVNPAQLGEADDEQYQFLDLFNPLRSLLGPEPDARGKSPAPINYEVDQGPPLKITYHVFYAYNDGPLSQNHEGDWERITVEFKQSRRADGVLGYEPDRVILSAHEGSDSVAWQSAEKDEGGRLLVYVAKGSHAHYFRPGNEPTIYDAQPRRSPYQQIVSPQDVALLGVERLTDDDTARDTNDDGGIDGGDGAVRLDIAQSLLLDVRQQAWYPAGGGGVQWGERGSALNVYKRDAFSGPQGPSGEKGHLK